MDTSKKVITIAYCGPAVDNGTMDVRDLAPALLAFSDFIRAANKALNNDDSKISVRVNADFHQGSFEIQLAVIKTLAQKVQELWDTPGIDAGGILALLGLGVAANDYGLIDLIKKIGGKVIKSITDSKEQPGKSIVKVEGDNNVIVVNSKVVGLYKDTEIRGNIEKALSPLQREGIDAFEVRNEAKDGNRAVKRITKEEIPCFYVSKPSSGNDDTTNISTQCVWVQLLNVSFEDLKWKLSLGDAKIHAMLNDEDFKKKIDKHKVWFAKGDMLKVQLETTQQIKENGTITNQYAILKVEEVRHSKEETELPFEQ